MARCGLPVSRTKVVHDRRVRTISMTMMRTMLRLFAMLAPVAKVTACSSRDSTPGSTDHHGEAQADPAAPDDPPPGDQAPTAPPAQRQSRPAAGGRPNIMFIMGDDIGWMQPGIYHR